MSIIIMIIINMYIFFNYYIIYIIATHFKHERSRIADTIWPIPSTMGLGKLHDVSTTLFTTIIKNETPP